MHRNYNHQSGCLSITTTIVGERIDVLASRIGEVKASVNDLTESFSFEFTDLCLHPLASVEHIGGISVSCGLVCTPNEAKKILEVQPEIIFLTRDNNWMADVEIISNVEWLIN